MINKLNNIGEFHLNSDEKSQDVICYNENDRFKVISLADGVSACKQAKKGAEVASQDIVNLLLNKGDYFIKYEPKNSVDLILSDVLYELKCMANENSVDLNEYSSTLSGVLLDKKCKKLLLFHLGDGIIMATDNNRCIVLAKPFDSSLGCCVTTTKGAADMAMLKVMDIGSLKTIIICSDGAWNLMYDRGKLKHEVETYLVGNDFDNLKLFMNEQKGFDDCSFVSMDTYK